MSKFTKQEGVTNLQKMSIIEMEMARMMTMGMKMVFQEMSSNSQLFIVTDTVELLERIICLEPPLGKSIL